MAAPAPSRPVVLNRNHNQGRANGNHSSQHQRTPTQILAPPRAAPARLKVIIRRLAPGLTEAEFVKVLGEKWKVGGERVDWLSFKEGKVSKDMSKPSRPGRAYLHLTKAEFLTPLSNLVRDATFSDAKNTGSDPCLLGPPSLEFSPYSRMPTFKPRKDARQGTIDQDLEFIDFLQELTNPVSKPAPLDANVEKDNGLSGEKRVTPLVQFLRDKKANKGKDTTPAKSGKGARQDAKDVKGKVAEKGAKGKEVKEPPVVEKKSAAAVKVEKAAREAVKVLNKQAASVQKAAQPTAPQAAKSQPAATATSQPTTAPTERKRGKVGLEAKNLLQRDLGLSAGGGRRRRGEAAAAAAPATAQSSPVVAASAQSKAIPSGPAAQANTGPTSTAKAPSNATNKPTAPAGKVPTGPAQTQPPTGPAASRPQQKNTPTQNAAKNTPVRSASPAVSQSPSTQAFLKHANPSQGITEPLLQEAFAPFGPIKKVEIDKKKGFAYVDFEESAGLHKAIAASPVKVAQGQVVVLERKEAKSAPSRQPRGGRGPARGRGGSGRGGAVASAGSPGAANARNEKAVEKPAEKSAEKLAEKPAPTQSSSTSTNAAEPKT